MYDGLRLGWYYGNNELNLRKVVADFVKKIAGILKVDGENIVFVGSSGGGAATFECAGYITGSKAISINPQIVLKEYSYAEEFSRITGNNLDEDVLDYRNNALHYIKNCANNQYLIIVNIRCEQDMKQVANIKKMLKVNIQYGLNFYNNLVIWLYDAEVTSVFNPHTAIEYYCIWFCIEYIINHMSGQEALTEIKPLYRLFNEFWHEHWIIKEQIAMKRKQWIEFLNHFNNMHRDIVVFGSGAIAKQFLKEILGEDRSNPLHIRYVIDNAINKRGMECEGLIIRHPSEIMSWSNIYIIIAIKAASLEVQIQLEELGLKYKQDFIYYTDL